jgi:hypothetical protein
MARSIVYGFLGLIISVIVGALVAYGISTVIPLPTPVIFVILGIIVILGVWLSVKFAKHRNKSELQDDPTAAGHFLAETPKSLRYYFLVNGLYLLSAAFSIQPNVLIIVTSLIALAFGITQIYIAIKFNSIIKDKISLIINFLWTQLACSILLFLALFFILEFNIVVAVAAVVEVAVTLYLISNSKRIHNNLSNDSVTPVPVPPAP